MKKNGLLVRQATIDDVPQLSNLIFLASRSEEGYDADDLKRSLFQMMDNPGIVIYLSEMDNEIIGMMRAQLIMSIDANGKTVVVDDILITKAGHAMKVEPLLLRFVELWAEREHARKIQIFTAGNDQLISSYRHYGFSPNQTMALCKKIDLT